MMKAEFAGRVRGCERRLYRIARTMLRSEADCEDVVQESLLRAWSRISTLREDQYFETWLIRILINECRALIRRRSRRPEEELPENCTAVSPDLQPLMDALKALPEKYRISLELHCIEGYSVREVARMLRVPEGTVKGRLSRGRTLLQKELGEEAQP